jgi:hypothetical protein
MTQSLPSTVGGLLAAVGANPAANMAAARAIRSGKYDGELHELRVAVLSTYTAALTEPYIVVEGARRGFKLQPWFGPFNQLEQQLLADRSPLREINADVIVLAIRLEEMAPRLVDGFLRLKSNEIDVELNAFEARMRGLVEGARAFTNASLLVTNFPMPRRAAAALADPMLDAPQAAAVAGADDPRRGFGPFTVGVSKVVY